MVVVAAVVTTVLVMGGSDKGSTSTPTVVAPSTAPASSSATTEPGTVATTEPVITAAPTTEAGTLPPTEGGEVAGAPPGVVGDRAHPVPAGTVANIGGGWRMQVLGVVPDAAAQIAANNEFNDPPPAGSTFMLVNVALGYFGKDDPHPAFEPTISAVGGDSVELDSDCGTIPTALDQFADLFAGGVITGNL